jgi:hypothetical protein
MIVKKQYMTEIVKIILFFQIKTMQINFINNQQIKVKLYYHQETILLKF